LPGRGGELKRHGAAGVVISALGRSAKSRDLAEVIGRQPRDSWSGGWLVGAERAGSKGDFLAYVEGPLPPS